MVTEFDRASESLGNILHMEHVNLLIPDQQLAILFYVTGLQFTRDPFLMVGIDNMWVNMGRSQMHLPCREPAPQKLRGTIGMVVPNLDQVEESLQNVATALSGTEFSFSRNSTFIEATCPWGNSIRLHNPAPEFGKMQAGLPFVELNSPEGSSESIARFYKEIMGASVKIAKRNGKPCTSITTGPSQFLHFIETKTAQPDYDGHHIAIYIADFVGPYKKLMERGLISTESDAYEWRFIDIVDIETGEVLFKIEHEVRSATHPLYARPLLNRNPAQSNRSYRRGQDNFAGII